MSETNPIAGVERRLADLQGRIDRLEAELRRRPRWAPGDVYALVALVIAGLMALMVFAVPAIVQAVSS